MFIGNQGIRTYGNVDGDEETFSYASPCIMEGPSVTVVNGRIVPGHAEFC
jgi:hypothetical protein